MSTAGYELVREYRKDDSRTAQFNLAVLSHYSYVFSNAGEALLIDPGRETDHYARYLKQHRLKLKAIFLTHSHADFIAGHIEAEKRFGAPIYISREAGANYRHIPLEDGDLLPVGTIAVRFLATPGHTLDGMCALAEKNNRPQWLFTGDTLFAGSVGRPDLMGGVISAAELAGHGFSSWREKLAVLPDDLEFFPAHGAGSLCGANLKTDPFSTIGAEKRDNAFLQARTRNEFIAAVLNSLPEAPQYFSYDAAMNRRGPEPVNWNAPVVPAAPNELVTALAIDLRDGAAYAAGHLFQAVNIALDGRFENWVGIIASPEARLVLVGDTAAELREGVRRLHRIGYTACGILCGEIARTQIPLRQSGLLSPSELYAAMNRDDAPMIVDVRNPAEFAQFRLGTAVNLPLLHLADSCSRLAPREPVVTVCHSAYRSSLAIGLLERAGFTDIATLAGGMEAWIEAGLPTIHNDVHQPGGCKIR